MNSKLLRKRFVILIFVIFMFFSFPMVSSQEYYADIQITVNSSGVVDIVGVSDHPDLLVENSNLYTYKKQSYWLLNITKEEIFSDYLYVLTLPEGSKINHIKTSGFSGIEEESGKLVISGAGQNEPLSIVVQYQINPSSAEQSSFDYILLFLAIFIIILIMLLVYFVLENKKQEPVTPELKIDGETGISFKGLTDRQKDIVKLLIEANRALTQMEIQKELDMPKAAVSRNVHSLEIKGLIEIEKVGMSNLVRLKKP